MKPRTLLILTGLAFLLAGYIFFFERELPSTDERRQLEKKVVPLEADEVMTLTLSWDDQELRLEKESKPDSSAADELLGSPDAAWRLVAPISARADKAAVESLISRLVGLEKNRTIEGFDAGELGLAPPRAMALLSTATSERSLKLGADLPLSSDLVVQGDDASTAFQVGSAGGLLEEMTRDVGEWRDRRLFTAQRADIEHLTLHLGAERVALARRGPEEVFWLEEPIVDRADPQDVSGLLNLLTGLEAATFLNEPPTGVDLGLEPPKQILEARIAGQENPWRLELGLASNLAIADSRRFARLGDQILEIDTASLEQALAKSAADWRSLAWSSIQVFKIDRASFDIGGESLAIRRDSGDWLRTFGQESDIKVDYTAASDTLYPLTEMRAVDLLDRAGAESLGHDLSQPQLEITLLASDGAEESLQLFRAHGESAAAITVGRDAVLLLAAEDAQGLLDKIQILRDAEPLVENGDLDEN